MSIANDYDENIEFTLVFDEEGDYTIGFSVMDLEQGAEIILGSITINVEHKEIIKLATPVVILDESTISWDTIENAVKYEIRLTPRKGDVRILETIETSLDLERIEPKLNPGFYNITVIALPEEDSKDYLVSDSSNKVQYFVESEIPKLENITPAEDIELQAGEILEVSFNGPTDGDAYFNLRLPLGLFSTDRGREMEEIEPGLYKGEWIVPKGIVAEDLIVDIMFISKEGVVVFEIAKGRVSVLESNDQSELLVNLPANTVIVGNKAFNIKYLNNNEVAQEELINWVKTGNEVYIKLNKDVIVNAEGELIDTRQLPDELVYYDVDGEARVYRR